MAKLVTKFKYLKPGARQGRGSYAKYIATRDGVEKIDDSKRFAPVWDQKQLIKKILRDFPDSKEMLEYEDYQQKQTIEFASEFIERFGSHGLFTDDGVQVNLANVPQELNDYGGNVWTVIISLRREDAERLGFDYSSRWRVFQSTSGGTADAACAAAVLYQRQESVWLSEGRCKSPR